MATVFILVSSIANPYLKRMIFVAMMKATTWTIIHSDKLYTDFLGLKQAAEKRKSTQHTVTNWTKVEYSSPIGIMVALNEKVFEMRSILTIVVVSISPSSNF